jgi:hypothetical protein
MSSKKRSREENENATSFTNTLNPQTIREIRNEIDRTMLMYMINKPNNIDENEVIKTILQEKNIEPTEGNISIFRKIQLKKPTQDDVNNLTEEYYINHFVPRINYITHFISNKINKENNPTEEKELQFFNVSLLNSTRTFFEKHGFEMPNYNQLQSYITRCTDLYNIFRSRLGTHMGVAFEVHNLFKKLYSKKKEYLKIIEPFIDKHAKYDTTHGELYDYIDSVFTEEIYNLFEDSETKIDLFEKLLTRAKSILIFVPHLHHDRLLLGLDPLTHEEKKIIGRSVNFVSKQSDNFKREYILSFLDESCSSQTTRGSTPAISCARGIAERFVTAIGSAVKILCIEENEECNDVYKELDKLMNPKFDIAKETAEWFNAIDANEKYKEELMEKNVDDRKKIYMNYLKNKSLELDGRKLENDYINAYIENQKFSYAFDNLQLGGKRKYKKTTKKSRKSRKTRKTKK